MGEGTRLRDRLEWELIVLLFLVVVTFSITAIVDPDLAGHIAYGRDHLRSGHLHRTDPYSFTVLPGEVWINHEWVFELVVAWVFRTLGPTGLVLLQAVAWSTAGFLILRLARKTTRDLVPTALAFLLFVALAFAAITIRPQLFTYLLFAVLLTLLEAARENRIWLLWFLPLLFLVWVNLHGGFLAGIGILGVYTAGLLLDALLKRSPPGDLPQAPERPWLLGGVAAVAGVLAIAATFINPYGAGLHRFLASSLGKARPQIDEWRSLQLDAQGIVFLVGVAAVAWAVVARGRREGWRRTPLPHVLVLVVTAALAARHVRHVPFFGMAAAAFATGALADLYRSRIPPPEGDIDPGDLRRMRFVYALVLLPALVLNLAWPNRDALTLRLHPAGNSPFPTGALTYMEEHEVAGNLLVHFDWAQLMIWRFHPQVRVFYDGRFRTVYRPELEEDFFSFIDPQELPGWRRALDEYPTQLVLLPADMPVTHRMRGQSDWRVAYQDPLAVLFVKRRPGEPAREPVLGAHPPPVLPFRPRKD